MKNRLIAIGLVALLLGACFPSLDDLPEGDLWRPEASETWHWQLSGTVDPTHPVDVYDIDLFDSPTALIDDLARRDRAVICYFSAGSREDWRPDADRFAASDHARPLDGWAGETWLDIRSDNVRAIMRARLDLAESKGCDGVEPDNVDSYDNDTGFPLTRADQLDFNRFLAAEAHARGLAIGLKNAVDLAADLVADFEFAVNESCLVYDECAKLRGFLDANKAVFHAEYVDTRDEGPAKHAAVCADARRAGLSTVVATWELDGWLMPCP